MSLIERYVFYSQVEILERLDLTARKRLWNAP